MRPSESITDNRPTNEASAEQSEPQTAGQTVSPWPVTPPSPEVIRTAISALSADGRRVTGQMLADHFGVSERTGRRYLSMTEVNA
jgi:response regulator of citrate/malate metabolism